MAIGIFKKKEPLIKDRGKIKEKPAEKKPEVLKGEKKVSEQKFTPRAKRTESAWKFLKIPHITEKATDLLQKNQYVFTVYKTANKHEIKRAIEDIYGVDVVSVKIINIPAKKRRVGKNRGWRAGYKKAIARLKEGQKIEVMPR